MSGERHPNVGFSVGNVGWMSGFLEEPDISFISRINSLRRKCRECRVLSGVETSRKTRISKQNRHYLAIFLISWDLNDAAS
jgi:hypothetical protein